MLPPASGVAPARVAKSESEPPTTIVPEDRLVVRVVIAWLTESSELPELPLWDPSPEYVAVIVTPPAVEAAV